MNYCDKCKGFHGCCTANDGEDCREMLGAMVESQLKEIDKQLNWNAGLLNRIKELSRQIEQKDDVLRLARRVITSECEFCQSQIGGMCDDEKECHCKNALTAIDKVLGGKKHEQPNS